MSARKHARALVGMHARALVHTYAHTHTNAHTLSLIGNKQWTRTFKQRSDRALSNRSRDTGADTSANERSSL